MGPFSLFIKGRVAVVSVIGRVEDLFGLFITPSIKRLPS